MEIIQGIPASSGIAVAPGFLYRPAPIATTDYAVSDVETELARLKRALTIASEELRDLSTEAQARVGADAAEVFQAHIMMLEDPDLLEATETRIRKGGISADASLYEVAEGYVQMLLGLSDEHFRARATDVRDVSSRVLRLLRNEVEPDYTPQQPSIIVTEDLAPSDTMRFDRSLIAGFYTARGGATSHAAILARALGVPAVVAGGRLPPDTAVDGVLILDGDNGRLVVDPDEVTLGVYLARCREQVEAIQQARGGSLAPAVTKDGVRVQIAANIGSLADAQTAVLAGAEGVGLFRTEFSYIEQNSVPNEEALFLAYRQVFEVMAGRPVVVRTLDIGGDKQIGHLSLPVEANPFLGVRGIRLCFKRPDLFTPQLRAILRAGVDADLYIMFPMVSLLSEVRQARSILGECLVALGEEGLSHNAHPKVGIMIEVPAAAVCADQLAREVDFFSLGTNDLTQYTLAADRTNAQLTPMASALQPAVLRLIKNVIDQGHSANIWVGMCGEMAGEPLAIPILLGLGLDEFSMNSPAIPRAKQIIRQWDLASARRLVDQALICEDHHQVAELVTAWSPS